MSHCLEGFFAEPANPVVDALALDGLARAHAGLAAAMRPEGDAERASLMAAAFAGGAAIHKGLGPAHAVAIVCGDQDLHHGLLVAAALPHTVALVARHVPGKAARAAQALGIGADGIGADGSVADALLALRDALGLPASFRAMGYRADDPDAMAAAMARSPFNAASPYRPTSEEYRAILRALLA